MEGEDDLIQSCNGSDDGETLPVSIIDIRNGFVLEKRLEEG